MRKRIAKKLQARISFLEKAVAAQSTSLVEISGASHHLRGVLAGDPAFKSACFSPIKGVVKTAFIPEGGFLADGVITILVKQEDLAATLQLYSVGKCSVKVL